MSKPLPKPIIWMVDISVFCNILNVPGRNQQRAEIFAEFEQHIKRDDLHMLPFTTVLETGNHIGQLAEAGLRKRHATQFVETVVNSIQGNAPWRPIAFPSNQELLAFLTGFTFQAEAGIGFGDHLIIEQWKEACRQFPAYIVKIWSTDGHLAGHACNH